MTPRFAGYEDKIRKSFSKQAMMETLGASLVSIRPGEVTIAAPVLDSSRQQHGFAHAALAFAIGDSAAGYAALGLMDEEAEVLTVEMKINLLAPASGDRLIAAGRVVRPGRRIVVVSAEVEAETGEDRRPVALMQGTMIPA